MRLELGASNYTYAEATWTQGLADWIGSHVRTFAFIGGVTAQTVSDNLKSGITKACFHEPAVNRTYAEMGVPLQRFVFSRGAGLLTFNALSNTAEHGDLSPGCFPGASQAKLALEVFAYN